MKVRYLIVVFFLLLTCVVVNVVSYDASNMPGQGMAAIAEIPMQIGQWKGKDMPLDEKIYEILETRSIIHRSYSSPSGPDVFLSIVYYTETKVDFHAPESCLGGQGFRVNKEEKTIILRKDGKEIPLRLNQLLRKEDGSASTLIWYFYKAGGFLGEDYIRLRLSLAINKFTKKAKSGSLIRISVPMTSVPDGEDQASVVMLNFLGDLYPYLMRL